MSKFDPKTLCEKVKIVWYELLAALRLLSIALVISLCTGCLNVTTHANGRANRPYGGTASNIEVMLICFYHGGEGWLMLLPIAVDLPLEVVADTVTLPYDLCKQQKAESRK